MGDLPPSDLTRPYAAGLAHVGIVVARRLEDDPRPPCAWGPPHLGAHSHRENDARTPSFTEAVWPRGPASELPAGRPVSHGRSLGTMLGSRDPLGEMPLGVVDRILRVARSLPSLLCSRD